MIRHILFRCPSCRGTTSTQAEWTDARQAEVSCSTCGAPFRLEAGKDRSPSDQEYYEAVRRYAVANRMDLASAYSVMEGILPRARVRMLPASSPDIPTKGASSMRPLALLAVLIIALGFLGRQFHLARGGPAETASGRSSMRDEANSTRTRIVPVTYQVDVAGALTRVVAPDPRAALLGLCQHDSFVGALQPIAIAPVDPVDPTARIGVASTRDREGLFVWVTMRLDPSAARWTIGDGARPVAVEEHGALPPGAEMLTF